MFYKGNDGNFYWTDETNTIIGPYSTVEAASAGFNLYLDYINGRDITKEIISDFS